jgi:aspartate/methionine/tyrosine aminotransferase
VNSPANPTGELRTAKYVLPGGTPAERRKRTICDNVFDWPSYATGHGRSRKEEEGAAASLFEPDCDNIVFSQSKHTGHAGSRFGWALVKDPLGKNH